MSTETNVKFLSVEEFKEQTGEAKLEVVKNPHTDKLFLSGEKGNYKVQSSIDLNGDIAILVEANNLQEACMVNVKRANVLATF